MHRALADATDPAIDPDRRAWHLAAAAPGPDAAVAAELEHSAGRARARGGLAAAAAFLERAAALTLEPAQRAQRALAAARAKHEAGAFDAALRLVSTAEAGPLDEFQRAQVDLLRGRIAFALRRVGDAPPLLLRAAKRFEPLDRKLARETYLEALSAGLYAGRLAIGADVLEIARAAVAAPPPSQPLHGSDLLLDGLARLITDGHGAGSPSLKQAVSAFRAEDMSREEGLQWLWLACRAAVLVWDEEAHDELSARFVQLARETGALAMLPFALVQRAVPQLFIGDFAMLASLVGEIAAVLEATGSTLPLYSGLPPIAFQGREAAAIPLIEAATKEVEHRGEGLGLRTIYWATAVLYNGLGRYENALAAARQACEDVIASFVRNWALVELIEAAARSGEPELAADALGRLSQTTAAAGTDWARGIEARSRALLSEGEAAERHYAEAIERLARTRLRVELARAHLLYGEWLRRQRRRQDAREHLRTAHRAFTEFGMEAFAERARVELQATGERARKRIVETQDDLTPQEAQVCRLAAEGATNQDIAARLFISPSTVDYHLRKAFRKLGVRSRHQLGGHVLGPRSDQGRDLG